ncbi:MAG: acyltransferase [Planctomycetes bacterium]|nr:acyltransferase [Planctomycetota bacterium]
MPEAPSNAAGLIAPRCPHFRLLDHWRGIACLLVVVYHSTIVLQALRPVESPAGHGFLARLIDATHHGNVGVPIFFVISGYCIAATADKSRRQQHSTATFFVRRFRRIYPPLWFVMLFLGIAYLIFDMKLAPGIFSDEPWAQLRPWWRTPLQMFGNVTLTESWIHHVLGGQHGYFPGQAWTLCYEEQFYFVTGMLLLVWKQQFFRLALLITVLTFFGRLLAAHYGVDIEGFFFDGYWLLFAAGIGVYYQVNYARGLSTWLMQGLLWLGLAWSIISWPHPHYAPAFAFAIMLTYLHRWDGIFSDARVLAPIRWCGIRCYSIYLVHQVPVKGLSLQLYKWGITDDLGTLLVTIPACLALSIALGAGFYWLVESRFLNTKTVKTKDAKPRAAMVSP